MRRESYWDYMSRKLKEDRLDKAWVQRPDWRTTLLNKISEIEKRLDKLEN